MAERRRQVDEDHRTARIEGPAPRHRDRHRGLAHPARTDHADQRRLAEQRADARHLVGAPDQAHAARHLARRLAQRQALDADGGRGQRMFGILDGVDPAAEAVAARGHVDDPFAAVVRRGGQRLAQHRHVDAQARFVDHDPAPHLGEQFGLADHFAGMPHQHDQQFEGTRAERHFAAVTFEASPCRRQRIWPEAPGFLQFASSRGPCRRASFGTRAAMPFLVSL
jgi:hypothetical protein